MSGLNVNFANVEASNFEAIKPGTYHAAIFEAELKESKSSDFPYLNIQFKLLEGTGAKGESLSNRRTFGMFSTSPKALFALKNLYTAVGTTTEELQSDSFAIVPQDLVGKVVQVIVGNQTYEGELRDRVKSVKPAKEGFDPSAATNPDLHGGVDVDAPSLDSTEPLPFEA